MDSPDDPRFGSPQWIAPLIDLDKFRDAKKAAKKAAEDAKKAAEAEAEGPDADVIPLKNPVTKEEVDAAIKRADEEAAKIREPVGDRMRRKYGGSPLRPDAPKHPSQSDPDSEDDGWDRPRHPFYNPDSPHPGGYTPGGSHPHPSETPHEPTVRGAPPSSPPPASPPMPGPPSERKLPSKPPKTPRPPGAEEEED